MMLAAVSLLLCGTVCLSSSMARKDVADNNASSPSAFNAAAGDSSAATDHQRVTTGGDGANYLCEDWGAAWRTPCKRCSAEHCLTDRASPRPPADSQLRCSGRTVQASRLEMAGSQNGTRRSVGPPSRSWRGGPPRLISWMRTLLQASPSSMFRTR